MRSRRSRSAGAGPSGVLVAVLATVVALAGACGSGGSDADASDGPSGGGPSTGDTAAPATAEALAGTAYTSTSVSGRELVAGTVVELSFEEGTMAVSAGCNTVFGEYDVVDGVLRWTGQPASTLIGCPEPQVEQDRWLTALLTDGAEATTEGSGLTLRAGEVSIVLAAERPGEDLTALLGRTWVVVGTLVDGVTRRVPARGRQPRLVVGTDGLSRVDTGCNTGRTVVRVDGDAFVFGPTTTTRVRCPQPEREIERRVLGVLDGRTDTAVSDGSVLVVTRGEEGLVLDIR